MKIHVNQIPPEGRHFEGEEDHEILELDDPLIRPVSMVRYSLDAGLSKGGLFATGRIEVDVEMHCVRCLEQFQRTLAVDDFALQAELDGGEIVDLTPQMREDTLLVLPAHPHCDWDGSHACPGNDFPAAEASTDTSAAGGSSAWDALDGLNVESER